MVDADARYEPRLTAALPAGWLAKEQITLWAPGGDANVIASSEPLDEGIDVETYAGIQGDLLAREFPGFVQYTFEPMRVFGGHEGYMRTFEWLPPDGDLVHQSQIYAVIEGRGFTATATALSERLPQCEHELTALLRSLRVT